MRNRDIIAMQEEMVTALGQPKVEFEVPEIPSEVSEAVGDYVRSQGWDVRAMAGDGYRDGPMEEQAPVGGGAWRDSSTRTTGHRPESNYQGHHPKRYIGGG